MPPRLFVDKLREIAGVLLASICARARRINEQWDQGRIRRPHLPLVSGMPTTAKKRSHSHFVMMPKAC